MAKIKKWNQQPTQDKLRIFVSSRLQECKDERLVARDAIVAINHEPILFEHSGARAYSARDFYLSQLNASQIMVAIHRLGYGFIDEAGGITISGLEEEFEFAKEQRIPTLLYVFSDNNGRDPRLEAMIANRAPNVKIKYYREPSELAIIKDDATATITQLVLRPEVARGVLDETPQALLGRAGRRQGGLVQRTELLTNLASTSINHSIVCVHGAPGVGKTVLTAQYADKYGVKYVRVSGLAPRELFVVCHDALAQATTADSTFSTLNGARLAFASKWAEASHVCLVVDECEYVDELLAAIDGAGGTSAGKRVIYTSRTPSIDHENFEIPSLTDDEAKQLLSSANIESVPDTPTNGFTVLDVQNLIGVEEQKSKPVSATAREIASYLALSPRPLTAEELLQLLGNDVLNIEGLIDEINSLGRLIDDSPSGYRMLHAQVAEEYASRIRKSRQRTRFYANRLVAHFEEGGDYRNAYLAATEIGGRTQRKLALAALREAAIAGDHRLGFRIADGLLKRALDGQKHREALNVMLQLISPLELMGDAVKAGELLDQAEKLALELAPADQIKVVEAKVASRARRTLAEADVHGLVDIHAQYARLGKEWEQARTAIELSALYIASKSFEKAVAILRPALDVFSKFGDEHGVDVAEKNLAASLAGLPGNEEEVDALVNRIEERSGDQDNRRQRAWYYNILTRRYRQSGRLDEAESIAKEILAISAELGEEALAALTYVNLGNIYSDKDDAKAALEAYRTAGVIAQKCGRRDVEADSSRLSATVLNALESAAAAEPERFAKAKVFAQHAIGLLQGSIYREALARAYVELGNAEKQLGNLIPSAVAYFAAATAFKLVPDEQGFEVGVIRGADMLLEEDLSIYVAEMAKILDATIQDGQTTGEQFIALVAPIIQRLPRDALVPVLGRHFSAIRPKFPQLLRPLLLNALVNAVSEMSEKPVAQREPWRILYAGLLVPFLAQDNSRTYAHRRLAASITDSIEGLDVRFSNQGDVIWTVALELERATTVSISPLDDVPASNVVAQSLAFFLKAFEQPLSEIIGKVDTTELSIQVAAFSEMPEDLRELTVSRFGIDKILEEMAVAVTRTPDFTGATPVMVFLSSDFLERLKTGEGVAGSLQFLFARVLVELVFILLKGEVNESEIRPKVFSLVRRTIA